jgi:hypothetical protein
MSTTVTMTYGAYSFDPVPSVRINRDYHKTEDGRILYTTTKITLDGVLTPLPDSDAGIANLMSLKDGLINAFNEQGSAFTIQCDGSDLLTCNPRINSLTFPSSSNNWVSSVNYTIELEKDDTLPTSEVTNTDNVDNIVDDWSMELIEDKSYYTWTLSTGQDARPYIYKLTHNLSAKGITSYSDTSTLTSDKAAWEYARDFCSGNMGYPDGTPSIFSLPKANVTAYNHMRTQNVSEKAGKYSLIETWLLLNTASGGVAGNALEDFTIDIKSSSDNDIITTSIQGSIQGLETVNYNGVDIVNGGITTSRWSNASDYWSAVQSRLLPRCVVAFNSMFDSSTLALNPNRINKSVGMNVPNGTINYTYEYSNKAIGDCVDGSLSEDITFNYTYPTDVYASIDVLGRASGPIIQLMGTRTPFMLSMIVDVNMPIPSGCTAKLLGIGAGGGSPHTAVKTLISSVESNLDSAYTTLVKTDDKINWQPTIGKYNRSVSWLYNSCTDSGTSVATLY